MRFSPPALGIVVAGLLGSCTTALGVPATWSAMGGTTDLEVNALELDGAGGVWAGGAFTTIGGAQANRIAHWDGTAWSAAGGGVGDGAVLALSPHPSGVVYAAGSFSQAGGSTAYRNAAWNPMQAMWSNLGAGTSGDVFALARRSNGIVYAGGYFADAGGASANSIAGWVGSAWIRLQGGVLGTVQALAVDAADNLYVGGDFFSVNASPADNVAVWNPASTTWQALGGGLGGPVHALEVAPDGAVYAGGQFTLPGGSNIAKWHDGAWSAVGSGTNGTVRALSHVSYCGQQVLYAGGDFNTAGGEPARGVAAWNGNGWSPVGSGLGTGGGGAADTVHALAAPDATTLYAGGTFTEAGGAAMERVARAQVVNLPCAPSGATALSTGPGTAAVSWTNPNSGPGWDDLVVEATPGGATCTTPTGTTCIVTGLENGTGYTFTVKAVNSAGSSPLSNTTESVTPQGAPGPPIAVVAVAGQEQATVSWMAPASNEGSAIVGYTVTASPGGRTCTTTAATTCTVTGLTAGTAYTFTVTARNGVGVSAASTASGAVVPTAPPPAPVAPTATPPASPAAATTVPPLRSSMTVRRGVASTTGTVPVGATRVVQTASTAGSVATLGLLEMARAKRATGACTIRKRTYTCAIRPARGTWTVTTTARGRAGVLAQGTRRVVVR